MSSSERYASWSHAQLIERIAALELEQKASVPSRSSPAADEGDRSASSASQISRKEAKRRGKGALVTSDPSAAGDAFKSADKDKEKSSKGKARAFDINSHPCRKIALRFSYDGSPYSGLAAQNVAASSGVPEHASYRSGSRAGEASASSAATTVLESGGLPTVEGMLWKALCEAKLVDPARGFEGAGWSRCGRTDRGVSAAGQVVSFWVRSRRADEWAQRREQRRIFLEKSGRAEELQALVEEEEEERLRKEQERELQASSPAAGESTDASAPEKPNTELSVAEEELPYLLTLNRLLPSTIRIQAWSPVRPDFSARFDCRYRHYKYFFTSSAPAALRPLNPDAHGGPGPFNAGGPAHSGGLDIGAMRDAASRLLGEHDFRNICKIDAGKQIENFRRRIDGVSIDVVQSGWRLARGQGQGVSSAPSTAQSDGLREEEQEQMYVLNLRGTAFLYHQVRHIVAVLFAVGAGLEPPSVVDELLNVHNGAYAADRLALRALGMRVGTDAAPDSLDRVALPNSTATGFTGQTAADIERAADGGGEAPPVSLLPGASNGTASEADVAEISELYKHLAVLEGKPVYEMAADRPLVLWDCGFKEQDIQWRTSTYDGPLHDDPATLARLAQSGDRAASTTTTHLHAMWAKAAIQAELNRHFVLAAPSPAGGGYLPASTLYEDARFPALAPPAAAPVPLAGSERGKARIVLPLGDGTSKTGAPGYVPLRERRRDDTAAVKNARWLEGKGKRKAEAKGITPLQLAKGLPAGSQRRSADEQESRRE